MIDFGIKHVTHHTSGGFNAPIGTTNFCCVTFRCGCFQSFTRSSREDYNVVNLGASWFLVPQQPGCRYTWAFGVSWCRAYHQDKK